MNLQIGTNQQAILLQGGYRKEDCQIRVLHIGIGAFHRSHQAYYFDRLLQQGHRQWGIVGVNLRAEEEEKIQQLQRRNNNYVLKTISPDHVIEYREIQSILKSYANVVDHDEAKLILGNMDIQLVTITISEAGYYLMSNGRLDVTNPKITTDIQNQSCLTIYGYLRQILTHRKKSNNQPITIACCDNMINNGLVLEKTFKSFLFACEDESLLSWVNEKVSFPRSMVDRITPKTDSTLNNEVESLFDLHEDSSILAESYIQWVIEDDFKGTKPPLNSLGVEYVSDIEAHENLKIKVLNGGHSCLAYFAVLSGYIHFDKAFNDQEIRAFFMAIQRDEILPIISDFSNQQLEPYLNTIIARFSNSYISDTLERICMDGCAKVQFYILPTIKQNLEQNRLPKNLIKSLAYWYVFLVKVMKGEMQIIYYDSNLDMLEEVINKGGANGFAETQLIWGDVPKLYPVFSELLMQYITEIEDNY